MSNLRKLKFEERFFATPEGIFLAKTEFSDSGQAVKTYEPLNVSKEVFAALVMLSDLNEQETFDIADRTIIITPKYRN